MMQAVDERGAPPTRLVSADEIRSAAAYLAGRIHRTPMLSAAGLGKRAGVRLWLKAESFQRTGSFKVRGALNCIRQLDGTQKARGLVTVSSGNHAQAVAWAAASEGVAATVVMPESASRAKVAACRGYGATVILHGDVFAAFQRMEELREREGLTLVHPFDDPAVIAGQGTLGLEIVEDLPDVDVVVVAIGGGGLISGVAAALRSQRPSVRIVGVEPAGAAAMTVALRAGQPVRLDSVATIADGLTAPAAGRLALEHVRALVDDVVTIPDEMIADALVALLERAKLMSEPAGATALAAVLAGVAGCRPGDRVAAVVSGGNLELQRLRFLLAERAPAGSAP
ncbi:MAG: Pyridoxal-5-phosphate-dependent protein beta subunit [Gemmatimonadetes bacterium]|jgi:threonine ammonia-lyase medium form|nr:Pyridoxal-5-phosphate-dependent protein beta subunit [Gemmatimonadota bacterium]